MATNFPNGLETSTIDATGNATVGGTLAVTGAISATGGTAPTVASVTATSDGLTTGLIPSSADFCAVTSANANNIITLPVPVVGKVIRGYVGANGCEMRTVAASGVLINEVDSDGTNEAAIPATTYFIVSCVSATQWILVAETELGARIAAIVPDAA
jgi:hypothetical protein